MSEHSQIDLFGEPASISSTEASPVRTSALPARVQGSTGRVPVCGGRCDGSCRKCDPVGFSLRTCLLSACEALTAYSLRWKNSATPAGRAWWVLGRWGLRTRGIESGSLGDWNTPAATTYGSSNNGCPGDGRTEYATKGRPSLEGQARADWLTPKAADGRAKGVGGTDKSKALVLQARDWPTVTMQDASNNGGPAQMKRNSLPLNAVVGLLDQESASTNQEETMARPEPHPITPKVCEACGKIIPRRTFPGGRQDSPSMYTERRYCNRVCQGLGQRSKNPSSSTRHRRAAQFLKSSCETCGGVDRLSVHHIDRNTLNNEPENLMTLCSPCHTRWHWEHGHLDQAKANWFGKPRDWPTPSVAIAEGGQTSRSGDRKGELLLAGMAAEAWTTARGSLNPDWVEQLMGAPEGWTALPDETVLRLWETRTRHTSPRSSDAGSSSKKGNVDE